VREQPGHGAIEKAAGLDVGDSSAAYPAEKRDDPRDAVSDAEIVKRLGSPRVFYLGRLERLGSPGDPLGGSFREGGEQLDDPEKHPRRAGVRAPLERIGTQPSEAGQVLEALSRTRGRSTVTKPRRKALLDTVGFNMRCEMVDGPGDACEAGIEIRRHAPRGDGIHSELEMAPARTLVARVAGGPGEICKEQGDSCVPAHQRSIVTIRSSNPAQRAGDVMGRFRELPGALPGEQRTPPHGRQAFGGRSARSNRSQAGSMSVVAARSAKPIPAMPVRNPA